MDWLTLGTALARVGAPILGSVFLGPAGGAAAGALVNVITGKLGTALGVPADPASITNAINADPAAAAVHVAPVEAEHADAIQAYLADLADARAMNVQLVQTGSPIAWATPAVALVAIVGFLAIAAYLSIVGDANVRITILAAMIAGWTTVLNFYLGSSKGGTERADRITSMLQQTITPAPASKPVARR